MPRRNFHELQAFVTVARHGSFTKAAAELGVTQSALSQAVSNLEAQLRIRLLSRTTRSVSPTAAGDRLLNSIGQRFDEIETEVDALTALRDKPGGTVRLTCGDFVLKTILLPKLIPLLRDHPDLKIEFDVSNGLRDIVTDRFDAGIRFTETVDRDMIAVPIGPDERMAVVASPSYFAKNPPPKTPRDLVSHRCINVRLPTSGGLYVWDLEKRGKKINVRVDGQLIFNTSAHIVTATVEGLGVAYLPEDEFSPHIQEGRLVRVLEGWCPPFSGYHLYYPSRRQPSPAFSLVLDALRPDRKRLIGRKRQQL